METLAARELCSISWLKYTWPRGNRFQWNVKISWRGEDCVQHRLEEFERNFKIFFFYVHSANCILRYAKFYPIT